MSIYFTNNYSKLISQKILNEIDKWERIINNTPQTPLNINNIILKYKDYIYNLLSISSNKFDIFITNGSKSYNIIFKLLHAIYSTKGSKSTIHAIVSNTDDTTILSNCKQLITNKILDITFVNPNKYGVIELETIKQHIKRNTKLISVPYINKELGTINNIKEIIDLCKLKNILYASNINQIFGFSTSYKIINNIDISFTSFDTLYGPSNLSLLIIRRGVGSPLKPSVEDPRGSIKKKILNDNLYSLIKSSSYSVNEKKYLPTISGSLCSIITVTKNRDDKNNKLKQLKEIFINKLDDIFPTYSYSEFNNLYKESIIKLSIVFFNNTQTINKTNTLLFSIYTNKIKINSNHIKKHLDDNNIIINDISNHISNIMDFNSRFRNGLLSISFGDHIKQQDINKLLIHLLESIKKQYIDLYDEIKDNIIVKKKLNQKKIKKVVRFSAPLCIGSNTKKHNHPKLKSILQSIEPNCRISTVY